MRVGEWLGLDLFNSIRGTLIVLCEALTSKRSGMDYNGLSRGFTLTYSIENLVGRKWSMKITTKWY